MTVTVVVRRQALPGQADALLALAFDRLQRVPGRRARRLQVRVFQNLASYENMGRVPAVVQCTLIQTAPETPEQVLEYLQTHRAPALKQSPGLLLRELHQDRNVPTRLCAIHGWESVAALDRHQREGHPHFESRAHELGASVEYFRGLTRAHVDRYTDS